MALTTLGIIGILTAAAGTAVSAYGSIQQGKIANQAAKYNAKVAENAAIAERQAAEYDASRLLERNRRVFSSQRAAFAKSGVTLSGSASDVMYDSKIQGELDVMTRLYQGSSAANKFVAQSAISRYQGKSALAGGRTQAGATLLTGAGQAMTTGVMLRNG